MLYNLWYREFRKIPVKTDTPCRVLSSEKICISHGADVILINRVNV